MIDSPGKWISAAALAIFRGLVRLADAGDFVTLTT